MMPPIQVSVELALPAIEPKTPQASTAAALSPPFRWPTNISAMETSGAAMRPRSITPPAIMKSGMASSTSERNPVAPVGR